MRSFASWTPIGTLPIPNLRLDARNVRASNGAIHGITRVLRPIDV